VIERLSGEDASQPRPRLSILIATWQAAATLERCLKSVFEQEFDDWELLIADGASTDGTTDILHANEARIAWWASEKDKGIYDAWNKALARARGEYVCFLGADDALADRGALSRLFDAIGDAEYDVVTSIGRFADSRSGKMFEFGSAFDYRRIGPRTVVCHPGLLHRRTLFEQYGLFDIRYRIAADLDFLLRLPSDTRALHVETVSVIVEAGGVSRADVLSRLKEQRQVLQQCPRYGPGRAYLVWLDQLWSYPIAQLFGISH
jgi:glycosyltransferase involved in cell wall biosynthesis